MADVAERHRRPDARQLHRRPLGRAPARPSSSTSTTPRAATSSPARRSRPAATSTPRSQAATQAFPALARHAGQRARAGALQVQGAARGALRGARAHRHDRARQDARRVARQRAARHRVRRGRLRRAVADDGLRRSRTSPPASTATSCASRSASFAAIAPFNFPAMVPLWFLPFAVATGNTFVAQAVRAGAALAAADVRAARAVRPAARRRQPRQRRPRRRRSDLRSSRDPRGLVRRLDAGRAGTSTSAPRTPASACRRSAARRTSSSSCPTPTSTASIDDHHRVVLRLRRRALPRGQRAACRSATRTREARDRLVDGGAGAEGRRRPRAGRDDGPGDQRAASRARASATSRRASPKARSCCSTAAQTRVRGPRRTATSSARRSSTTCRRRWRSAARRSSGRSRRSAPVKTLDEAIALMHAHPERQRDVDLHLERQGGARVRASTRRRRWSASTSASRRRWRTSRSAARKDSFFGDLKAHGRDAFEFYTDKKVTISRWF